MPVHRRAAALAALASTLALSLGGCALDPAGPAAAGGTGPAPVPAVPAERGARPYEVVLTADLRELAAGRPDAGLGLIETRQVVAGDRTQLVISAGGTVLDQHVTTPDEHWLWVQPELRHDVVEAEWVHLDVAAVEGAGGQLPRHVAAARGRMPGPDEVRVGDDVGGYEVLDVEALPDGGAVRLTVSDLPVPLTLRRRALPATTTVELPRGAVDLRELPGLLGG